MNVHLQQKVMNVIEGLGPGNVPVYIWVDHITSMTTNGDFTVVSLTNGQDVFLLDKPKEVFTTIRRLLDRTSSSDLT